MNALKSAGFIALAAILLIAYLSVFTVDEREKVLVLRFGEINHIVEQPGLYFKLPIADEIVPIEDRIIIWESNDKSVQVVDGRRYSVDTVTFARVNNAQVFRERVGADLDRARANIETRLDAALRQTYGRRTFSAALSADRPKMMEEIRNQVRPEALSLGIEIVDMRIRRTDLMPDVLEATYDRMSSERQAEATDLRAYGEARKLQITALADRTLAEELAKARRQGEIIRGEGDAERNRIFAEAFSKDPEFFAFYRSMQAYAKSLGGNGTTLVLKPDSQFFKYFGSNLEQAPKTP